MSDGIPGSKRALVARLISSFYIFAAVGTLAFCEIAFATSSLPPAYLVTVAATALLTLMAAVALVLLRRQAFLLFTLALIASLVMYAWPYLQPAAFAPLTSGRVASTVIGVGLMIAVCAYSRSLKQKGVLR